VHSTTTLAYNGRGQTTSVTNALSQTTTYTYDTVGNLAVVTDALTRTTEYDYDDLNRLILVTDALDGETEYAYDANGNLTSLTDANNHTTSYTYDGANRAVTMTDPLSEVWAYTYDDNHNLILVEQPNGNDVSYEFDAVNRLTGVDLLDDSSLDIEYAYDDASRWTSMVDDTGTTTYSYDDANRLTSVSAPTTGTVNYGYNEAGQLTSLTYPSTHQVTYGYNSRGELETVTDWLSGITTYTYDPAGRMTEIEYPNDVIGEFAYDDADRLTAIEYLDGMTSLETISYVLNAVGMRTSMTGSSGTTDYTYDALYRLTEVEYPNSDLTEYGYDAVGNRTSLTIDGSTPITNTYNDANALTASGSDSYSYDENGNLETQTVNNVTTDYTWDAVNRLIELDDGTTVASYDYNGVGLRVAKTVNSVTTDYTWDQTGIGQVIAIQDEYVRGLGLISQITGGGTPTYAHQDGLGSVRLLTDSTAAAIGTETYDAFGESRSQTGSQMPFTYTGEQSDAESGLVYLRARFMDPKTGQFLSRDPIGFAGGDTNLYAYVKNNPARFVDPRGLYGYEMSINLSEMTETWTIGDSSLLSPQDVIMALSLQWDLWPFNVSGQDGEIVFKEDHSYDLGGAYYLFWQENPIQVTSITPYSMTFLSLPGHSEGAGNEITFCSSRDENGDVWLDIVATGPDTWRDNWFLKDVFQGVIPWDLWNSLANNVASYLTHGDGPQGSRGGQ
jgi:RHS repeat-associated protein